MKISKQMIGVLALLGSSVGMAATVNVVPSNATPNPGDSFFVTVSGVGFLPTTGATLHLQFNSAVVSIPTNGIALAPGSPFTNGIVAAYPFNSNNLMSVVGPTVGALPSGSFDAFRITFNVSPTAAIGSSANILLVDDHADFGWTDADGLVFEDTVYNQAQVAIIPLPAAAWLIAPAVLAAGRFSRRRKAA